jgi:hypothetical protein
MLEDAKVISSHGEGAVTLSWLTPTGWADHEVYTAESVVVIVSFSTLVAGTDPGELCAVLLSRIILCT